MTDRERAQQWLAQVIHEAVSRPGDADAWSNERAAYILDTPGVEVQEMTMYVGKPGSGFVAETRLHIILPVESIHV